MVLFGLLSPLGRLSSRPDFRRNPVRAVLKRVWWRLRWRLRTDPWLLKLPAGPGIYVARTGAGALIYYQGHSEPTVARLLKRLLGPGSVFVDVGAHLGEYALLAAAAVGPAGEVHAFEPNPALAQLIRRSVKLNGFGNVSLYPWAVGDADGEAALKLMPEASLSYIAADGNDAAGVRVRCVRLDTWAAGRDRLPHVIKVDVEGAEPLVFRGAEGLLSLPSGEAPALVFEHHGAAWGRFGRTPADVWAQLSGCGYRIFGIGAAGEPVRLDPWEFSSGPATFIKNLLAVKGSPQGLW